MIGEVVDQGRLQRIWLIGALGICSLSNVHLAERPETKPWRQFIRKLSTSIKGVEHSDLMMGDFNIPPREECDLEDDECNDKVRETANAMECWKRAWLIILS